MIGKSGQNGFSAVDFSILGQAPRRQSENSTCELINTIKPVDIFYNTIPAIALFAD